MDTLAERDWCMMYFAPPNGKCKSLFTLCCTADLCCIGRCATDLQMVNASHSLHCAVFLIVLYWPLCHHCTYGMTSPRVCGAVSISFYSNFTYVARDQVIVCMMLLLCSSFCIVLATVPSLGLCCDLACVCRALSYNA